MEHIIGKLLKDFEEGKMNRRQLIQSLALAASAAGAAVPAAAGDSKGFKTLSVNHISYVVADYTKTRDFYVDLMGMKPVHDDGKQCSLGTASSHGAAAACPPRAPGCRRTSNRSPEDRSACAVAACTTSDDPRGSCRRPVRALARRRRLPRPG